MCIQNATNHSTLFLDQPVPKAPFTRYNLLSIRFDNRLYRVCKHSTGCQTGLTTGWMFVKPVVQPLYHVNGV